MKSFYKIFSIFALAFLLVSCQKELYFDLSGQSEGTLKADASTNNCLPFTVNGVYKVNTATNADNYIDVQVNVTAVGLYSIVSDTLNGISFRSSGVFETTGLHTVRLFAAGTPVAEETTSLTLSYNNTTCIADIDVLPESSGNPDAVFTLGGSGSSCTGAVVAGTYTEGVAMAPTNTMTIDVSVTTPGNYSISTNTINGVSFSSTGSFVAGTTTVTLVASGTPEAAGAYSYTVTAGTESCTFSVTFDPVSQPAVFTFSGSPGNCTGAVIQGEFSVGNQTGITNSATVTVDVTSAGTYTISTPTVNGISFFASGAFTSIGVQQVILIAGGTPTSAGTFNYSIDGGSNSCTFSVPVVNNFITCNIDGVFTTFNYGSTALLENSTGFPHLSIDGSTNGASADPSISLQIFKSNGGNIIAGTYNVNQVSTGIAVSCDYNDAASANFYNATDPNNQAQNPGITITITSITSTRCIGTFSGQVFENSGLGPASKLIENGTFDVPVR